MTCPYFMKTCYIALTIGKTDAYHMRTLYTALLLILAFPCFPQGNVAQYRFTCQRDLEGSAEKFMIEEVVRLDPNARISLDGHRVKIAIRPGVEGNTVLNALQRSGVCDPLVAREFDAMGVQDENGFPVYIPTGEPAMDDATYDAAKQQWILSNPAAYETMGNP